MDRCAALFLNPGQDLIGQGRACVKACVINNEARRSTLGNDGAGSDCSPCRNASGTRRSFSKRTHRLSGLGQRLHRLGRTCDRRHTHGGTAGSFQAPGRQEKAHGSLDESTQQLFRRVLVLDFRQSRDHPQQLGVRGTNLAGPTHLFADDVSRHVAECALGQVPGRGNNQPRRR